MIDFKEIPNGERWEGFAQGFLTNLGYTIESPPARGADGGFDMLVSQQVPAGAGNWQKFIWLVSGKNNAVSDISVNPSVEFDIPARIRQHKANGFMGFYSTIPSRALVNRAEGSISPHDMQKVEFFSGDRIAGLLISQGMTFLMQQFLPRSLAALRPVHPTFGNLIPLLCETCGNDLLQESILRPGCGMLLFRHDYNIAQVTSVHLSCKGACHYPIETNYGGDGIVWPHGELRDYLNPAIYMHVLQQHMNRMRYIPLSFTDQAHDTYMRIFAALSQRTFRITTQEDLEHYNSYLDRLSAFS